MQRVIGLVLVVFAVFHAWVHWPALRHREAWLARVTEYGLGMRLGLVVVALLGLHALLGYLRVRRVRAHGGGPRVTFQAATGLALALFLIVHLRHVWTGMDATNAGLLRSYEVLWSRLGKMPELILYVLGCGVLASHVAHGFTGVVGPRLPAALRTLFNYAAGATAIVLFVLYMQLLGRFALGEPMLPMARPEYASELRE